MVLEALDHRSSSSLTAVPVAEPVATQVIIIPYYLGIFHTLIYIIFRNVDFFSKKLIKNFVKENIKSSKNIYIYIFVEMKLSKKKIQQRCV
jgi:hypothetical protein